MAIQCPYCHHEMSLKGARAGEFTPRCGRCRRKFLLQVFDDPNQSPLVQARAGEENLSPSIASVLGIEESRPPQAGVPADPPQRHEQAASPKPARRVTAATDEMPRLRETSAPPASPPPSSLATVAPSESAIAFAPTNVDIPVELPPKPVLPSVDLHGSLGGYEILKKLGQGGMGAVYLARQVSLDRQVAVKVLHPKWAGDPHFVARFTREAYAAAQLVHHNVVQIHDIGCEKNTHFFSMEYVPGKTLSQVLQEDGKVDHEVAVGYALQAARGLKFAHDRGMVHRDVKPENLLLSDQGIVKVADLGLVKTFQGNESLTAASKGKAAGPDVTQANQTMGTPAFMSPEQASDATKVDQRSDIYSLGCTLYDLITGRPPFTGKTAVEVMTKHQREPITPPEFFVKRIPATLSAILMKMVAKDRSDRYDNLGQVIRALEDFLGLDPSKPFSPKEEHVAALESAVAKFQESQWGKIRSGAVVAFFSLCGFFVLMAGLVFGQGLLASALLGYGMLTVVSYVLVQGFVERTFLFGKIRELVFGVGLRQWANVLFAVCLFFTVVFILDLFWPTVLMVLAAVGSAALFHFTADRLTRAQREEPLLRTEAMLKQMRLRGLDEDALRHFVCRYAGERWEPFYEAMFGYEAKLEARTKWGRGERGKMRKKSGAWREPVVAWIEARLRARREEKERRHLQMVEARSNEAKGMTAVEARRKARNTAEAVVAKVSENKRQIVQQRQTFEALPVMAPGAKAYVPPPAPKIVIDYEEVEKEIESGRVHRHRRGSYLGRRFGGPLTWLVGPQVRFIAGLVLCVACLAWMKQNGLLFQQHQLESLGTNVNVRWENRYIEQAKPWEEQKLLTPVEVRLAAEQTQPLQSPFVPQRVALQFFNSYNVGLAGLVLLISSLLGRVKMGLLIVPAAAIILAGHLFFTKSVSALSGHQLSLIAGGALTVLGYVFCRED